MDFVANRSIESLIRRRGRSHRYHLAISLTNNCPLKCEHCIVSALHGGIDKSGRPMELASTLITQLRDTAGRISALTFTGGESSLAPDAFAALGTAASEIGIQCGLISSGYWATTEAKAASFLEKYRFVERLTISVDEQHQKWLPLSHAVNAIRAAQDLNIAASVRLTGEKHEQAYISIKREIETHFGPIIEHQSRVAGGRASDTPEHSAYEDSFLSQCLTSGPHIDFDGRVLPCCSNIIDIGEPTILDLGNVFETPLVSILDLQEERALDRVIRVWGWDYIVDKLAISPEQKCELGAMGGCRQCAKIMKSSELQKLVEEWLDKPQAGHVARLADGWLREA